MSIYPGILEYCLKKLFQICIRKVTEMKKTIYLAQASLSEDGRLVEITGREFYDIVTSVLGEKRYFVRLTDDIDYEGTEIIIEAPKDYYNEWRKEYRRHLDIRKANSLNYVYDANGNQIRITGTADGTSVNKVFTYTPSGLMSSYTSGAGTQVNRYSGDGQRVSKTEGSDATNYFYQDGSVLYTTDSQGNVKAFNLLNVSDILGTLRINGNNVSSYFYTEDMRGSTVNVIDNSGNTVLSYWYDDFGQVNEYRESGNSLINEVQYTGAIYDELTGLLYLNARFYDPATGRFISQDTYRGERDDAGTWHLYVYCANDPVNYVDPSGHVKITIRRWMIATPIDLATVGLGLGIAFAPVKQMAKSFGKAAAKHEFKTKLFGFAQKFKNVASEFSRGVVKAARKLPGSKKWGKKLNAKSIEASIYSFTTKQVVYRFADKIVKNIDICLSLGGLISGILDYKINGGLNNKLWEFNINI